MLLCLSLFQIIKLNLIFNLAAGYFESVAQNDIFFSLLNGLRFDLYVIGVFLMPLQLLLLTPAKSKLFIKVHFIASMLIIILLVLFCYGDSIYFSFFNEHITTEVLATAFTHINFFIKTAFSEYLYIIIIAIFFFTASLLLGLKIIDKIIGTGKRSLGGRKLYFLSCLMLILITIIMIRGNLNPNDIPLRILDASLDEKEKTSDIALNGIFTTFETLRKLKKTRTLHINYDEAVSAAIKTFITSNEVLTEDYYPLMRKRINFSLPKYDDINVAVIILESFDRENILKNPESAPFLLSFIKNNGIYFDNIYSQGRRSLMALQGLTLCIPYINGMLPLNNGLEAKNFIRFGSFFRNNGYYTLFIANEDPHAERMEELARRYFFIDEYYSKNDIPVIRDYPEIPKGYDMDALEFFLEKINNIYKKDKNFISYFWTSSTHLPYTPILSEEHAIYGESDNDTLMYLNRVRYADASLENFFEKAKKEAWFDNTIFILVPDHRAVIGGSHIPHDSDGLFKSFMFIYAPKFFKPSVNHTYGTIADITPTIIDLLHIESEYSCASSSLFDNDRANKTFIFGEDNSIYTRSKEEKNIINLETLDNISKLSAQDIEGLSISEALYQIIRQNRFFKKE